MAFRFWRRIKLAPGLTLNLSKSGGSLSFGPRGAKFTVGPRGKRATVGLPGTGLFYTKNLSSKSTGRGRARGIAPEPTPSVRPEDRLELGFFKRLITPDDEEAFVDGCRELALGNEGAAYTHLARAAHLADGAYLAGFLALKRKRWQEAESHLMQAAKKHKNLGAHFSKYGVSPILSLPISDHLAAQIDADYRGVLLGLVEIYQRQQRWRDAVECLYRLLKQDGDDILVKTSLAELFLEARPGEKRICQQVAELAEGVENESEVHAALLLYQARALRELGLFTAARTVLTKALRRKKDRPDELLHALRYERAQVYDALGNERRARSDLEKLYVEAPDYEDVAERLGLN